MVQWVDVTFVVVDQIAIKVHNIESQNGVANANGEPRHGSMEMIVVGDVQLPRAHQKCL